MSVLSLQIFEILSIMKNLSDTIKNTPTIITIFLGIFLLTFQIFRGELPPNLQMIFFGCFILTTGIPHGALDHLIQKHAYSKLKIEFSFMKFLVKYLLIMLFYGLLWYYFSGLGFIIFIIISAWHFGETDIEGVPNGNLFWNFIRLIYGVYILAFIILIHNAEASPVVKQMLGGYPNELLVWNSVQVNAKQILYLMGLVLVTFFMVAQSYSYVSFDKFRIARLLTILVLTIWLPLIPAFVLYFAGWHALCAFDNTFDFLKKGQSSITFRFLYLNSMPFTILAIIFLSAFLWFCKNYTNHIDPIAILFIFISLITLPHLLITNQMNQLK